MQKISLSVCGEEIALIAMPLVCHGSTGVYSLCREQCLQRSLQERICAHGSI